MRDTVELAVPLRTPLGLSQWKRASSRGEAGTSDFLSVSDSDRRVPAELGQESQASSRGEAKDSALLPSHDTDLLQPPSGLNVVKPPLHFGESSRDCSPGHAGKESPSPREDRGFSGVSSSCGVRGAFLTRHDEVLREPLVLRQGSQVSVPVARGSASWLSSHGRGLGPREALKRDS